MRLSKRQANFVRRHQLDEPAVAGDALRGEVDEGDLGEAARRDAAHQPVAPFQGGARPAILPVDQRQADAHGGAPARALVGIGAQRRPRQRQLVGAAAGRAHDARAGAVVLAPPGLAAGLVLVRGAAAGEGGAAELGDAGARVARAEREREHQRAALLVAAIVGVGVYPHHQAVAVERAAAGRGRLEVVVAGLGRDVDEAPVPGHARLGRERLRSAPARTRGGAHAEGVGELDRVDAGPVVEVAVDAQRLAGEQRRAQVRAVDGEELAGAFALGLLGGGGGGDGGLRARGGRRRRAARRPRTPRRCRRRPARPPSIAVAIALSRLRWSRPGSMPEPSGRPSLSA